MADFAAPHVLATADPVELTRQLCNIESVSGSEGRIADAIERAARTGPHLHVVREGNTVIARTELGRDRRVAIAGHLDTVPVNGQLPVRQAPDPLTGDLMLWGRGTVDMKAGVAVQLALALELVAPTVDVTWVWYDNEEVDSSLNGLGRAQRTHPDLFAADFAILGEPTNARVEGGCNGTLRAKIVFTGRRAHSARSWMGVNAIHRAAKLLERLSAFVPETRSVDGLEYREGLNAVGIRGGVAGNVIPDLCEVEVNFRFAPDRSPADAAAFIREFCADADQIEIVDLAPGARPGLHAPLAQAFLAAVGGTPTAKVGWTDVARFSALGVPAVNFGPGDPALAHADDERVPIAHIESVASALRAWLSNGSE